MEMYCWIKLTVISQEKKLKFKALKNFFEVGILILHLGGGVISVISVEKVQENYQRILLSGVNREFMRIET